MLTKRKVAVVGAGAVGSTFAYTLMRSFASVFPAGQFPREGGLLRKGVPGGVGLT